MASARRVNPQTFNRYSYALNNPFRFVDPSGLAPCPPDFPNCQTDEGGDYYTTEDGIKSYIEPGVINVPSCSESTDCGSAASPSAALVGPPPVVSPGAPAPVTTAPPGGAPSVGRIVLANAIRSLAATLIAPTAVILATPSTVQAPVPLPADQTPTTTTTTSTTTTERDRDPLQHVYRVWGGRSRMNSDYWTPIDPRTVPNYRDAAGLPDWNTGEYLVEGDVQTSNITEITVAKPLHGNQGGIIEYRINPANIRNKVNTKLLKPL